MKIKMFFCLLLFIQILIGTTTSAQQNLYLSSTSGDDSGGANDCTTAGFPCLTIAHAFTQADPDLSVKVVINVASGSTYNGPITINRSNITLRGAFENTKPVGGNRDDKSIESVFQFAANSITINNGVNDITIEGFEFRSGIHSTTTGMVTFAAGSTNSNIVLRRNSIVGNSRYSGGTTSNSRVQPFLVKAVGGSLTNIQIVENRFYGYGNRATNVIEVNSAESGVIRGNIFGSATEYTNNLDETSNYLDKGILLSSVKNFAIAQNIFQTINFSAIELLGTLNTGVAINDAIVRIDSNVFDRTNSELGTSGTFGVTEPTIAAGILLRPHNDVSDINNFNGDSVLIRFNDFVDNNRYAIAIPNANNNFTTKSIKIFSNRFSVNNFGNSYADLYVGTDTKTNNGIIDANANWWGNTTSPFSPIALTTPGLGTDIQGAAANTATGIIQTYISLSSNTDNNLVSYAFIPNKVAIGRSTSALLKEIFNAIAEDWTLELPVSDYENAPAIPIVVRSFTLNPLDVTTDGELLPGFILNGTNTDGSTPIITLNKNIQIANGDDLTLTRGKIQLGVYTMRVLGASGLPEGNANSYIITNSTGKLLQTGIGASKTGEVIFPIGPDNISYTPARITNAGVSNDFSVVVKPGIVTLGNDGNTVTEDAVDLEWDVINETLLGTPNVTLTLQWNGDPVTGNEQLNFDRSISYMAHYTGGKWVNLELPPGTAAVAGSIPGDSWKKTASGITSFSPFAIGSPGAALPVTLVDFKAALKNNDVELSWITASEKENDYFSVERSDDGSTFSEIGKINGKGTTDISNAYNFTDVFATEIGRDVLYYRLKQVDTDGKFSYSKIQDVVLQNWALRLFPNPADHIVNIALPGKVHLQVISTQGQVVIEKKFESLTQLNVSGLPKGMYIFKLTNGRNILFRKVNIY
ncbi:T9SS type A sorting domain-containing protein [Rhodocytophaga rosea]|uniref:T9SS type A sorting domain-containing protein n=1 Tax=Rhodocytophaga rosea TaxID=2704465 RepID=A0A6C0GJ15_9BACT|nr:T9SS type A sorting domain-containing protein [Rhodocytophaga rosea]QHT68026.1 T9SS type A sorting domain-containing protein [Rhodocytophaga rosea]